MTGLCTAQDIKTPGLCSCCGVRVWTKGEKEHPQYRRVHFLLFSPLPPDPVTTFFTFCPECSQHAWNPARVQGLNQLLKNSWMAQDPKPALRAWYESIEVLGCDPHYPIQNWDDVNEPVTS